MFPRSTKKLLMLVLILSGILIVSCQKEPSIDLQNPPPIPAPVLDSTGLIKSISNVWNNGRDTIVENYFYDTVNRRITLSWTDNFFLPGYPDIQSEYNGNKAELNYNDQGLLSVVQYIYSESYRKSEWDYDRIEINYDEDNIVKNMTAYYIGGAMEKRIFTKIKLPGIGYSLAWTEGSVGSEAFRKAVFNDGGDNIMNQTILSYEAASLPSGEKVYTRVTRVDSLVYENDALVRIQTMQEDTARHSLEKYITYEFSGRLTKGDQLYNHRQTIMNGIANIPFQDGDGIADAFGRLSAYLEYEWLQYSPYPVTHSRVRMWDGRYDEFTTTTTFDDKNRLTRLSWFVTDLLLDPCEYLITYYK